MKEINIENENFVIEEDGSITTPFAYPFNPFAVDSKKESLGLKSQEQKDKEEAEAEAIIERLEKLSPEELLYFGGWFYGYEPYEIAYNFVDNWSEDNFDEVLESFRKDCQPEKHGFGNFDI